MAASLDPAMSDARFRNLVTRELNHAATEDEIAFLRRPDVQPRWREALIYLRVHAEAQADLIVREMAAEHQKCLAMGPEGKSIWFRYKEQAERRKASAGNFVRKVQLRLSFIRSLRQQQAAVVRDETYWRSRARRLGQLCNEIMQAEDVARKR
jgi:hypothetical protein